MVQCQVHTRLDFAALVSASVTASAFGPAALLALLALRPAFLVLIALLVVLAAIAVAVAVAVAVAAAVAVAEGECPWFLIRVHFPTPVFTSPF